MQRALDTFAAAFEGALGGANAAALPSLLPGADAFAFRALLRRSKIVLAVTPGIPEAERLAEDLHVLATPNTYLFPPLLEGRDEVSSRGMRLKALEALRDAAADDALSSLAIVAPFAAIAGEIEADVAPAAILRLDSPSALGFSSLAEKLLAAGYSRMPVVEREGDLSIRGGIVDAWSPGEEAPFRAEFFGDELDSLRVFDPGTQTTTGRIERAVFMPCAATTTPAADSPFLSLLPDNAAVLALEHGEYELPLPPSRRFSIFYTGAPVPPGADSIPFHVAPLPGFSELAGADARHPELFELARSRLERHLAEAKARSAHVVAIDELSGGFEIPGLAIVTKSDRVFAKRRFHRYNARKTAGRRIDDFAELEPGEYVVHSAHGIGKFIGSSEIQLGGHRREVFTIEYDGGALLHVPADHAHLISRYVGVKGEAVKLHKLGGRKWDNDQLKARKAVADLAAALLETQASRETAPGFACDVECDGLAAFEAAFPYEETPDQASAIADVKKDLASPKPMDRLICGDAGYGKTEVAMRAAYIAAMNGRQVALLAPTTVLAEQHYETFISRFDGTPLRIECVSRFQSPAVREGTFARLATGVCDIVIGTHALLTRKAKFKNLGLVVIDEEQRFGVRHKEYLKRLRANADVLTLSATPIPRTLYLSMTGARDLSILRTPPRERVAVDTSIIRDSDEAIRTSIEAELRRGGQVFFLHNRVATLPRIERRLKALLPRARITLAHGQMDSASLAEKIHTFERGKSDILLSTTIVESGIDIPRANTIIIDRADTFGLADLYQLRGRVGRSSRQGHAILLLPPSGQTDSEARERLRALQRHGGLGAGFSLALRDLELRGAGNLLGAQQSGHIAAIGFTLYCQLLQRTIALLKGEKVKDVVEVAMNLDFIDPSPDSPDADSAAALPYSYIEDDSLRMHILARIAKAADLKTIGAIKNELRDRFGPLPPAAKRFLALASLRIKTAAAGFARIDTAHARALLYRPGSLNVDLVVDLPSSSANAKIAAVEKALKQCNPSTR